MRLPASWDHLREQARTDLDQLAGEDTTPVEDWNEVLDEAWLEGARRFDPTAHLQPQLDVRVMGDEVGQGSLSMRLADDLFGPLQSEVEAASPGGDKDQARLELTGLGTGSAVLHLRPRVAIDTSDEQLPLAVSRIDGAIRQVFEVHDAVERGVSVEEIKVPRDLLAEFHRLIKVLLQHGLAVEMNWRSLGPQRRRSALTQQGLDYAARLFEFTDHEERTPVAGYVYDQSLKGSFRLKADPKKGNSSTFVIEIPPDKLSAEGLRLNEYRRVMTIRRFQKNQFGQRGDDTYEFVEFLPHDEPPV